MRAQSVKEDIVQRRFSQAALQLRIGLRRRPVIAQHFFVLQAAKKFKLAKLLRLKSAGRLQLPAKCQEMRRQHRLQNRELLHQHASDLRAAPQQPRRFISSSCD